MKLSEKIQQYVEEEIWSGTLLPGDVIDETELSRRFDASRTPVREALIRLEAQSMLISRPRQGMVVAKMDVKQLLAIWELLLEMEVVCARLACDRMTAEELDHMASVHAQAQRVVELDDVNGWRKANRAFHDCLYLGSRNPYLRQEILRLRARTGAYLNHAFSALGRLQSSQEQHARILEALQRRDAPRVESMMTEHVSLDQGAGGVTDFIINLPSSLLSS